MDVLVMWRNKVYSKHTTMSFLLHNPRREVVYGYEEGRNVI
jgi:hypothetical protein